MSRSYGRIAFTPAVQHEQERHGSRRFYRRHQARAEDVADGDALTDEVRAYLSDRDSFYLASVSETGWPYVQFRGGPPGFLTVLSDHTIGWADFRGNLQYVSVGNVRGNDRVALIVMHYPSRQRLKIYGHASIAEGDSASQVLARLADDRYEAVVERAVVVTVAAFDWNCQQHITPRYTLDEISLQTEALRHRLAALEAENAEFAPGAPEPVEGRSRSALTPKGHCPAAGRIPSRYAIAAASPRLPTDSFPRTLETWTLAVFTLMTSSEGICGLDWPAAPRANT